MVHKLGWWMCGVAATCLLGVACDTTGLTSNDLGGVVVTLVDSGPALSSARTFALPDTIVEVPLGSNELDHSFDHEITFSIRRHFTALGWIDLTGVQGARPDVLILTAANERIETGVAYADWFGGWGYLPYWGAGVGSSWAWGVPGGAIPYAYQAGTLLITMLDLRHQDAASRTIPLLWAGALDGIITTTANTVDRILTGIDQAFTQSPYLRIQ